MALAEAGGILSTGKPSSVMVVRTNGVPEAVAIKVDVSKFFSGRDLTQDLPLEPYDVVFVPKSVIGKVGEFVDLFFTQIAPAQLVYLRGYDMVNRRPLSLYQ
jgi:polysaccharide export outer membrane protein